MHVESEIIYKFKIKIRWQTGKTESYGPTRLHQCNEFDLSHADTSYIHRH